jgi:hypothetical protein
MNQETTTAPQEEGVRPLAEIVTNILKQEGHPNPEGWMRFLENNTGNLDVMLEDAMVRRALSAMLVDASANGDGLNTIDERMAVLTTATRPEWIRIFQLRVAPCVVKNQLPLTKH